MQTIHYQLVANILEDIIKTNKLKLTQISAETGINYNTLNNIKRGLTRRVPKELFDMIILKFPNYSEWEITEEKELEPKKDEYQECKAQVSELLKTNARQLEIIADINTKMMNLYERVLKSGKNID
jgi:predicted transcriptional regulator